MTTVTETLMTLRATIMDDTGVDLEAYKTFNDAVNLTAKLALLEDIDDGVTDMFDRLGALTDIVESLASQLSDAKDAQQRYTRDLSQQISRAVTAIEDQTDRFNSMADDRMKELDDRLNTLTGLLEHALIDGDIAA